MQGSAFKTTFTLAEAADLLSCHKETLRRAIQNGELRAAKVGKGYRLSRLDLEAFWSSSGGGDLFPKTGYTEESSPKLQEHDQPKSEKDSKAKDEPQQLSLFTT